MEKPNYKQERLRIESYLSLQNYEHFKRLVLQVPDRPSIEYIEGFEFEWGYDYLLKVKETKLKQPLSDGTSSTYKLEELVSKTRVSDSVEFQLYIDPSRYYNQELGSSENEMNETLKELNDSTYIYFEGVEIEVPQAFREEFRSMKEQKQAKMGTFVHVRPNRIGLVGLSG